MNKTIASGLIGLLALGGAATVAAPAAFAQDADDPTVQELTRQERFEERRAEREAHRAEKLAELSELLGVTVEDLRAAHEAGQSIADIAAEQGIDVQSVIDALAASAQAHIDEKVAAGELDADRAAEISENLVERVTARVNGERPEGLGGEGRGPRGHGPHGPRGDQGFGPGPGGADSTASETADA